MRNYLDVNVDRDGTDLVGEDEHGRWFGTEAHPLPLEFSEELRRRSRRRFTVYGYLGPDEFDAHVLSVYDAAHVEAYFRFWGVRDVMVAEY